MAEAMVFALWLRAPLSRRPLNQRGGKSGPHIVEAGDGVGARLSLMIEFKKPSVVDVTQTLHVWNYRPEFCVRNGKSVSVAV